MHRRRHGYSRKAVIRMLGYSDVSTLSRWERGITLPRLEECFLLAKIYHMLPQELYAELWDGIEPNV
jgi:transcriptional regulator with XRE-family HTH domain